MRKYLIIAMTLLSVNVLMSCSDNDDDLVVEQVPQEAVEYFNKTFPGTNVVWEWEHGLLNADFHVDGVEIDMWFTKDGRWVRTETDWRDPLPDAVQTYIASNHPGYMVDDVDWVDTPQGSYFDIELEANGRPDVNLRISQDGKPL